MAPGQPVAATGRSERSSARALFGAHLRAVSLVTAVVMTASACSGTTAGTAQRANDTTTAATTSTGPAIVPTVGIKGKLLSLTQLGAIVGDTDMRQLAAHTEPDVDTSGLDPYDCRSAMLAATSSGYYKKTRQAMIGDTDRGARGQAAAQVISVFASRDDPAEFLNSTTRNWASCLRQGAMTLTGPPTQHWTPGQLEQTATRIALTITRQEPPPRTCHHVVAAQANIAVEAVVCGDGDTVTPANQIVDTLLAKFPT
jgi:hypothetical protein